MNTTPALHRLLSPLFALALSLSLVPPAQADDLDIYTDPTPLPTQAPLTVLSLDLNLSNPDSVICDNLLLTNSSDPDCQKLQQNVTVEQLGALLGTPLPDAGAILLGLNPEALVGDVLAAGQGPILSSVLGLAPAGVPITNQAAYALAIQQILASLVNTRLAIMLNHDNKGPAGSGVCAFGDLASIVGYGRNDTVACSNGAYFFLGLTDLTDLRGFISLTDLLANPSTTPITNFVDRIVTRLLPSLSGTPSIFRAQHPYQVKEIYAELAKYLRGDAIFNGHLGYFDYGDTNPTTNLNTSFPALSWDPGTERTGNTQYKDALAAFPQACNINLVHIQATNARSEDDSDAALRALFPDADTDGNGVLTQSEVVSAAGSTGFVYGNDRRRINSRFVVQENLFTGGDLSELDKINRLGGNVTTYTDVLGLLGRGTSIAGSLIKPLSVDATLTSLTIASSRSSSTGRLDAAYLPVFRADPNQKPAWPGNLKRLALRDRPAPNPGRLFDVVDARNDPNQAVRTALTGEGKIRDDALTLWTDATRLGAGVSNDGNVADKGGAGQRIPGFAYGGGGNPGRSNSGTGVRRMYYDSMRGGAGGNTLCGDLTGTTPDCGKINPDDSAVRSELQAATGATSYVSPGSLCASTCNGNFSSCGLLCNTNQTTCNSNCSLTQTSCNSSCSLTQTTCGTSCSTNQTTCTTGCATTAATCNLTCLPGTLGNSCRATCTANQNTCNTGCTNTATSCNGTCTTNFNTCSGSCTTNFNTCSGNCTSAATTCNGNCNNSLTGCLAGCPGGVSRDADAVTRELLLYARGFNVGTKSVPLGNGPATSPANSGVTSRPWMMGSVLHSRPLAINYGRLNGANSPEVVRVVFGSADGVLHMVDDATGIEQWGFMPQAVMGNLPALRENQTGTPLPYGVDGSPVVLIRDRTGNSLTSAGDGIISTTASSPFDRILLIFGLRRGGAGYYALDVTNPDAPRLVWRITTQGLIRAGDTAPVPGSAAQFASLALAFSTPQVGRIRYDASGVVETPTNGDVDTRSVLVFGGGYNGGRNSSGTKLGKDLNNTRNAVLTERIGKDDGSGSTDRGNALFMIDAATGELLWRAVRTTANAASYDAANRSYLQPMLVDSIASDVTLLDTDNDGFSDRLYVGDTGGRLWRADFPGILPSAWTLTPLVSVGRHTSATVADDRRIFFAPDFVPLRNTVNRQGIDLVLFGTGDREDPLNLTTNNSFYALKDDDPISGKLASEIIVDENDTRLVKHSQFDDFTDTASLRDISGLTKGYRFFYPRSGEKHFSTPVTLGGITTFTTYVPPDPSLPSSRICVPEEGGSRLFKITTRKAAFFTSTATSRDTPLSTGLPGEINALAGTQQAAGGTVYEIPADPYYRASWRERLGETQK